MQTSAFIETERVEAVLARTGDRDSSVAFQGIVAAAAETVDAAVRLEASIERLAPSSSVQDSVARLRHELESVAESLRSSAGERVRSLLPMGTEPGRRRSIRKLLSERGHAVRQGAASWSQAADETLRTLEAGMGRMAALAACQSPREPSRALAAATADLLQAHHIELTQLVGLTEAGARS